MKHRFLYILVLMLAVATGGRAQSIDLTPNDNRTVWTLDDMPDDDVELVVEYYTDEELAAMGVELTKTAKGEWTLDEMPDYDVDVEVVYDTELILDETTDNASALAEWNGYEANVTLSGRTLWQDGHWNTLCLPFAVNNFAGTPLEGATVKGLLTTPTLDGEGQLTLDFSDNLTAIEAGRPYIVKWDSPADLTISTSADWDDFAERVNNGTESFEGKTVRLAKNISVTTMVGTLDANTYEDEHPFKGTFDGAGHTLNVAIDANSTVCAAPFRAVGDATIRNLVVTGSVSGGIHCSGLVGKSFNCLIENCDVRTNIVCSGSYCGGLLGHSHTMNVTIRNSRFGGSISGANTAIGIIFGWGDKPGEHIVENCLADGTYRDGNGIDILRQHSGTQKVTNSYKTQNVGSLGTYTTATGSDLQALLGNGWTVSGSEVMPKMITTIANPVFKDVTIDASAPAPVVFTGGLFVGSYKTFRAAIKLGDVNNDNVTNDADLTALTDYLTGKADAPSAPDVNGDGEVNIVDIAALIGILVSPQSITAVVSNVADISLDNLDGTW